MHQAPFPLETLSPFHCWIFPTILASPILKNFCWFHFPALLYSKTIQETYWCFLSPISLLKFSLEPILMKLLYHHSRPCSSNGHLYIAAFDNYYSLFLATFSTFGCQECTLLVFFLILCPFLHIILGWFQFPEFLWSHGNLFLGEFSFLSMLTPF